MSGAHENGFSESSSASFSQFFSILLDQRRRFVRDPFAKDPDGPMVLRYLFTQVRSNGTTTPSAFTDGDPGRAAQRIRRGDARRAGHRSR
jgi:hypothetical protein